MQTRWQALPSALQWVPMQVLAGAAAGAVAGAGTHLRGLQEGRDESELVGIRQVRPDGFL